MHFTDLKFEKTAKLVTYISARDTFADVANQAPIYPEVVYSNGGSRTFRIVELSDGNFIIHGLPDQASRILETRTVRPSAQYRQTRSH
jgi:hypothetical protein